MSLKYHNFFVGSFTAISIIYHLGQLGHYSHDSMESEVESNRSDGCVQKRKTVEHIEKPITIRSMAIPLLRSGFGDGIGFSPTPREAGCAMW